MGLALIMLLLQGIRSGLSTVAGGFAYWLPTLIFVRRIAGKASAQAAKQFVLMFFAGETVKLLTSAILFVLVMKYLPVTSLSVLIGYIGAIVAFWVASVFYLSRQEGASE